MVGAPLFVAGALASTAMAGILVPRQESQGFSCGSVANRTEMEPSLKHRMMKRQAEEPADDDSPIELNLIAHMCCSQGGNCASEEQVKQQVAETNKAFEPAKITFNLQKVTQVGDKCSQANFANENILFQIMRSIHEGDLSTINVMYINNQPGQQIQGLCNVMSAQSAPEIGDADGCIVAMDSLGGQGAPPHAKVTTHELGHAMGLEHPFGGGPGSRPPPGGGGAAGGCPDGDGIPDTPPQSAPSQGCPNTGQATGGPSGMKASLARIMRRQTAAPQPPTGPGGGDAGGGQCQPGANAQNIMDYSECPNQSFSEGQIKHMRGIGRYRTGKLQSPPLTPAEAGQGGGATGPGGKSPGGQPPGGQTPGGQPPSGQPPTGQPPTGQPPSGQPPADQPPPGFPADGAQSPGQTPGQAPAQPPTGAQPPPGAQGPNGASRIPLPPPRGFPPGTGELPPLPGSPGADEQPPPAQAAASSPDAAPTKAGSKTKKAATPTTRPKPGKTGKQAAAALGEDASEKKPAYPDYTGPIY